jgi:outer membrane protein OmpA-like peptidoglycan-associated protein
MNHRCIAVLPAALLALAACGPSEQQAEAAAPAAERAPWACDTRQFTVYFDEWQAELTAEARQNVAAQQDAYDGCAIQHVLIVGLADATGDNADNLEVSRKRAENVADLLEERGWPRSVLEVAAVGETGALDSGRERPMRRAAHVTVMARAP